MSQTEAKPFTLSLLIRVTFFFERAAENDFSHLNHKLPSQHERFLSLSEIQIYSDLSCCQVSAYTQKTIDQRVYDDIGL